MRGWIYLAVFLLLLFGFAAEAQSRCAPCERKRPGADFLETVTIAEAGQTVTIPVLFRNRDTCGCGIACFALSAGWHPPHDGTSAIRIGRTSLQPTTNGVCLAPGEEVKLVWVTSLSMTQDGPGYVTPVAEMRRSSATINPTRLTDFIESEGRVLAYAMTYEEAVAKAYAQTPSDPE